MILLLELAVGDAYGAGFEFCDREKISRSNTLQAYVAHDLGIEAGRYTDDTQMSVAVAEVLLSDADGSSDAFADAFVRCYRRDLRKGYAKGLQALLDECGDGAALRQRIRPDSRRNGAAMRSVPLGLVPDPARVLALARSQAVVTHDTPEAVLSSQVVALMAHHLVYSRAGLDEIPALVEQATGFALRADWAGEVECDAVQTLHAVATSLLRNRRMSDLLLDCVNHGGDVDSVAAIAMGLASLAPHYTRDIPPRLLDDLESGPFGSAFLRGLDSALATKYPALAGHLAGRAE